ncbi:MAG: protein kinase [Chloroflexi bacterium]|nr:protein kinase [Chloroflexota bacterium]
MELAPETLLHQRYRILQKLGQGGMGAVYLAHDTSLESRVAVKSNHSPADESSTQFLREAQLLANLRHPNLPRVIDYFLLENNQYLVMDYIPGKDLGQILQEEGPQPVEKVLRWADALGSALAYMHRQRPPVIHRDIKPANIKLDDQGEPILVDFGIAKASEAAQATEAGAAGFTPGYAPPEQYGGSRTGPYSDQYALAATLYALLSGLTPSDSVQRALGQAVLSPLNLLNKQVPAHVQAAIERAMSVRPQERFASIEDFTHALTDPTYQPTQAAARPAAPPARPLQKKIHPGLWIAGAVLAFALTGGSLLAWQILGKSTPAASLPTLTAQPPTQPAALASAGAPTLQAAALPDATQEPAAAPTSAPTSTPAPTETPQPRPIGSGRKLAFVSDRAADQTLQIWGMDVFMDNAGKLFASEPQPLTSGASDKTQPAWSPDGSKLLYVAASEDPAEAEQFGLDIWMLDLSQPGAQPANLTRREGDDTHPAWSPDGRWIAFANQNPFTSVLQVVLMNPDGSEQRRISGEYYEYDPAWSPDMSTMLNIIYASSNYYLHLRDWQEQPYPTPIPTSKPYDRSSFFGRLGQVSDFDWSPDGNYLAYTRQDGSRSRVYVVEYRTRGEKISLLTQNTTADRQPAWSRDSQWIAFTSERDGNAEIYIMTATGLLQTNLTNSPAADMQPVWQP